MRLVININWRRKSTGGSYQKGMDQNEPSLSTAEKIAKQHNVSPATVKRHEKFAEAVDKLPEEERKEVLAGKSGKTKAEIADPEKTRPEPIEDEESDTLSNSKRGMASYLVKIRMNGRNINSVRKMVEKALPNKEIQVDKINLYPSRAVRLNEAETLFEEAKSIIESLKEEMENWKESLPDNLQDSEKANQLDECISNLEEIESNMENCDFSSIEFPSMMG